MRRNKASSSLIMNKLLHNYYIHHIRVIRKKQSVKSVSSMAVLKSEESLTYVEWINLSLQHLPGE